MVSVIIPAYNAEMYIGKAIESLLNQTYQDIEIVIINDGSTDNTQKKIEEYQKNHPNIKLFNVDNGGVSKARNIGIDHAAGEFIAFLDADDVYLPDAIEKMIECIVKYDADICTTCMKDVGEENRTVLWDVMDALKNVCYDHPHTYSSCAKLYRSRKITEANIRFPEGKRIHEDSFFIFCCIINKLKIVEYNIATYVYNTVSGSASRSSFSEKFLDILPLAQQKYEIICIW